MAQIEQSRRLKTLWAEYDFAKDAGAVGAITLRGYPSDGDGNLLPAGSVVLGGYIDVETAALSATGTIALHVEGAGDIVAAAGQASWTVGRKSVVPAFTGASSVKTTQARSVQLTIATAVFTAGKFRVCLFYV